MMLALPAQRTRRRDVVLLFSAYPMGTWVLHQLLAESTWYLSAHVVFTVFVLTFAIRRVARAGRLIADDADARLDERQLAVRNAAYLDAYRIVSAGVLLGTVWIAIGVDKSLWWIPTSYNEWNDVFWGLFIVTLNLPAALLSWREPDRNDAFAANPSASMRELRDA